MCVRLPSPPVRNFKRETGFVEKELMPKTEKVTQEPETWRRAFRSHRRTRSSRRGDTHVPRNRTVSWEVSRLRAGRQGPWGALGRPPLQAAPWGTAALWLRMEVGWRWTRSRTQGSMIWDSSSSRSEKVPVASGGPREHPSKGSTCSSRKSLSGSGVGSLRRTLVARAVLGQRDSSGWCGVFGADSPRAEPRLPQSRVCGSREAERRWLVLPQGAPQGAPGPACTCVPVCVCVCCSRTRAVIGTRPTYGGLLTPRGT